MKCGGDSINDLCASDLEFIDGICVQFEQQWQSGSLPGIELLLDGKNGRIRTALFIELLKLDIDYRQKNGLSTERSEYDSRFPQESEAIGFAFSGESADRAGARDNRSDSGALPVDQLKLVSHFRIERFHARGGLGEVYIAKDERLDRIVAVKFPRNRAPNSFDRLRLEREAEITSRLKHPGIVPVHATSHGSDRIPCYIMPFIEGQTYRDAIVEFHAGFQSSNTDRFATWDFRRLVQRLVAVGNTVAYAHGQGVIHRDIKPGNIMLGPYGETFLMDWGLAKIIDRLYPPARDLDQQSESIPPAQWRTGSNVTAEETRPDQPLGTPEFASPEQVMGRVEDHDRRSDVYSLGATLCYLLLGKGPVDASDLTNLASASALRRIESPRKLDSNVPAELSAICMKAISFEAQDRYADAQSFTDDLERYLADEPVSVGTQRWSTSMRRWIRKNPRLASGVATGIAVTLIGISMSAWMLSKKSDELAESLALQERANIELAASKDNAQAYANNAMAALRTLSSRVVQQWFAEQSSFSDKEREFLQSIVTQYQDLARSESDERFGRTIEAEAFQNVGRIQMLLGQNAEALASLENAIGLLTPLPDDATAADRILMAKCVSDRGKLLISSGDIETGIQALEDGIHAFESVTVDFPEDPNCLELTASAYEQLGRAHVGLFQSDQAIDALTKAQAITSMLIENQPDNAVYLDSHATKTCALGAALAQTGDHEAAIREYQIASDCYETLLTNDALYSDVYRASGLPVHYIAVAQSLMNLERIDEATENYERAIEVAHRIVQTYPLFPGGLIGLARAHHGLAGIYSHAKQFEMAISESGLAVEAACRAVELAPENEQPMMVRVVTQLSHAAALKVAGDLEQAESAYAQCVLYGRERFAAFPTVENRVRLATDYYRLATLQKQLKKKGPAIEQLQQAVQLLETALPSEQNYSPLENLLSSLKRELALYSRAESSD